MALRVVLIPALQDNYQHLLICEKTRTAAIVDPAEADSVLAAVKEQGVRLTAIFNTHHHWDHTGGNEGLFQALRLPVYCSAYDRDRIAHASNVLKEGDRVAVGELSFEIFDIPGHTLGHIAFYGDGSLFCGDTLFAAGCGRLFEGTPAQMHASLQKLARLPVDTKVYCGHEYTLNNLLFARLLEAGNEALLAKIESVRALRKEKKATLPTLMSEELSYNPFLRVRNPDLKKSLSRQGYERLDDDVAVLAAVRDWKNNY